MRRSKFFFSALSFAFVVGLAHRASAQDTAPISLHVTDSARKETSKMGRLAAALSDGNVRASVDEVTRALGPHNAWLVLGGQDSEVWLVMEKRSRQEIRNGKDSDGNAKFDHVYNLVASLDFPDRSVRLEADHKTSQEQRNDNDSFKKVAEELAFKAVLQLEAELDRLRPGRPQTGFAHKIRTKMLVIPDGLEITNVAPGSPADRAGLRVKDRVKAIDGDKDTGRMDRLVRGMWASPSTGARQFAIERDKEKLTVSVSMAPRAQWDSAFAPLSSPTTGRGFLSDPVPATSAQPSRPSAPAPSKEFEIKLGMSEAEILRGVGEPQKRVAFNGKSVWTYDAFTITFQGGKVVDIK